MRRPVGLLCSAERSSLPIRSIGTAPTQRDATVVIIETAVAIVEGAIVAVIVGAGMGIGISPANSAPAATIRPATIQSAAGNVLD